MSDIEREAELCPNPPAPQADAPAADRAVIEAPEGVEIDLVVYLHSDAEGYDLTVAVRGLIGLAAFLPTFDPLALIGKAAGQLSHLASDWRVMTREEIATYKRGQDEMGDG